MDWLVSNGRAIELASDIDRLAEVGLFGQQFVSILDAIDDQFESVKAALSDVSGGMDDTRAEISQAVNAMDLVAYVALNDAVWNSLDDVADAIDALGISSNDFRSLLQSVRDTLGRLPDKYYKLLRHVDAFAEKEAGDDPGLVNWATGRSLSGTPDVGDGIALSLSASGSASLQFEAGHLHPDLDANNRYLRIGVRGELDSKVSATVPFNMLTLTAGAGASGKISTDFLFTQSTETGTYALEAAEGLKALANPFALRSVYREMRTGPLHAFTISNSGQSYLETSIGLSRRIDIAKLVDIEAGLTVEAEVRTNAEYRVEVSDQGQKGILVNISSSPSRAQSAGTSLGVVINASSLADKIKSEAKPLLSDLADVFNNLDDYLQPGKLLRDEIDSLIEQNFADENVAMLLRLAVGRASKADVEKKLGDELEGFLDTQTSAWEDDLTGATSAGATWLIRRYPALEHPSIKEALSSTVSALIQKGKSRLKNEVSALSSDAVSDLLSRLELSGVRVENVTNSADAALSGLEKALQNYRKTVENILLRAEELANSDLRIQVTASSNKVVGSSLEATAKFTKDTDETRKAYYQLMTGDLKNVLALVDRPVDGCKVQLGTWQRFAEYDQAGGFSVLLLDFNLTQSTLFSSESRVQVDASGALSVMTRADWKKRREFLRQSRQFQFTSVYSLLAARHSRSFTGFMQITYADDQTDADDILEFFDRLVEHNLIDPNTIETAEELLKQAEGQSSGGAVAGNISARLELTRESLERLIGVGRNRTAITKQTCAELTLRALRTTGAMSADEFHRGYNGIVRSGGLRSNPTPSELLLGLDRQLKRRARSYFSGGGREREKTRKAIEKWVKAKDRCMALHKMIRGMKAIYTATPLRKNAAKSTLESWYQDQQKPINKALEAWISMDGSVVDPVRAEVSDETLALLSIIDRLALPASGGGFLLQGYLRLNAENRDVPLIRLG